MTKLNLPSVTLAGIDGYDVHRIARAVDVSSAHISFGAVMVMSDLPIDRPDFVGIPPLKSLSSYCDFLLHGLVNYVKTDFVLNIQHDGFVLNPDAWTDEFLEYDYIGAPWIMGNMRDVVGNGGFSLRSRRLLSIVDVEIGCSGDRHEDLLICIDSRHRLESLGLKFAPAKLASRFSVENIPGYAYGPVWDGQFGYHGTSTDISKWRGCAS